MAAAHQTPTELVLQHRISTERLAPYIRETPPTEAIRLYPWNIELSGAVYEALHVFEVALRNALDKQLCVSRRGPEACTRPHLPAAMHIPGL
jgi:hypothetical protein